MTAPRVTVVGGGISGLTVAATLVQDARRLGRPLSVVVLDAGVEPGGHARTLHRDGFAIDLGPNGFLTREPQTLALVESVGLTARLVEARPDARRRYLLRGGRLCRVPDGPAGLVTSPALSWRAKLRLAAEPFASGPPPAGTDETVHAFAARRLGAETADMLVDAAVAGISAGDSRRLSVAAQFPALVEMERTHGGLLRAMLAPRPPGHVRSRLVSFDRGMGVLTAGLAATLGDAVWRGAAVRELRRDGNGWRIGLVDGRTLTSDAVVLATAAGAAAPIVRGFDRDLADGLAAVEYAGLAVAALGYRRKDLRRALDGYGYLAARSEGLATLGVVWESSLFPGRAPDGHVLLRVMLGGSRRPEVVEWSDEAVLAAAERELAPVVGVAAPPVVATVARWPAAIAQYTVGHAARRAAIGVRAERHAGLALCGTSYDGVSFNDAVKSGRLTARRLADTLWARPPAARDEAADPVLEAQA